MDSYTWLWGLRFKLIKFLKSKRKQNGNMRRPSPSFLDPKPIYFLPEFVSYFLVCPSDMAQGRDKFTNCPWAKAMLSYFLKAIILKLSSGQNSTFPPWQSANILLYVSPFPKIQRKNIWRNSVNFETLRLLHVLRTHLT